MAVILNLMFLALLKCLLIQFHSLTAQQINSIYQQTIDQSKSTFRINERHGRIASSIFNEIKNLVEKMQKDISYSCPEYLIAAIMGYEKPVVTW